MEQQTVNGEPRLVRKYTSNEANQLHVSTLKTDPVFHLHPAKMDSATISQDSINELLAKGIPALSPPCGAGDVGNGIDKNLNMLDFKTNDWTQINPVDNQEWFHSDVKNKAFFYIHTFFKELLK